MSILTSKDILCKQSGETIVVSMDFSNWIDTAVTLSNPSTSVDISGLTITGETVSGQTIQMTIAGGTNGATYRIQVLVETSDSQILIGDGILKVRDR